MLARMLWMAQSPSNFYHVFGTEYRAPNTWINGNPPLPSAPMATAAIISGVVLLLGVFVAQRRLARAGFPSLKRGLAMVCLVVGFFALWEGTLQICARQFHEPMFVPDPATFWSLNPQLVREQQLPKQGKDWWWERRVRPLPDAASLKEKPPGTYRIMFFGESQLVSIDHVEVDIPHSYPHVLGRLLAAVPGSRFDVVNAGVPGFSSWQGLMLCRQLVQWKPDLVVFAFGYHDGTPAFARDRDILTDNPRTHALRSVLYRSQLFLLARKWAIRARESQEERRLRLEHEGPPTFRVPLPDFEENMRDLVRLGQENGFRVAFMFEPQGPGSGRLQAPIVIYEYQEVMRKVAADSGALILDVFNPMRSDTAPDPTCWNDDVHMSSHGHEVVAGILLSELQGLGIVPRPGPRR